MTIAECCGSEQYQLYRESFIVFAVNELMPYNYSIFFVKSFRKAYAENSAAALFGGMGKKTLYWFKLLILYYKSWATLCHG